jgi:hypothetical protein
VPACHTRPPAPGGNPDDERKEQIVGASLPGTAGNDATIRPSAFCSQFHSGRLSACPAHRNEPSPPSRAWLGRGALIQAKPRMCVGALYLVDARNTSSARLIVGVGRQHRFGAAPPGNALSPVLADHWLAERGAHFFDQGPCNGIQRPSGASARRS